MLKRYLADSKHHWNFRLPLEMLKHRGKLLRTLTEYYWSVSTVKWRLALSGRNRNRDRNTCLRERLSVSSNTY